MRTWLRIVPVLTLLAMAGIAWADIGVRPGPKPVVNPNPIPPGPAKSVSSPYPLEIAIDDNAKEAHIYLPLTVFRRAELDPTDKTEQRTEAGPLPTIMTGLCLAMTLGFGGIWLARHRGDTMVRTVAAVLLAGTLGAVGSAVVFANGAIPRPPVGGVPAVPPVPGDRVILEIINRPDNTVKLVVSKKQLEKVLEDANKKSDAKPQK
jgi:hypothetical protein